jgi:hypothetical protein
MFISDVTIPTPTKTNKQYNILHTHTHKDLTIPDVENLKQI